MNSTPLYKDIRLYTVLGIIAFLFFHHYYGYFGHYGFDDIMGYGRYAKKWADGELFYINDDFFSYRWSFISLTAIFYALLGMNDHTSSIAPSLILLCTVWFVFRALKNYAPLVGAFAAVLYTLDNWTMYYSDKLMADTSVALGAFASFVLIAIYRFEKSSQPFRYALALSLILIWSYIAKETVLLLFPAYFLLMLTDLFQKRHQQFWIYTIACCIVVGLLYLLGIYILTGNPMMRFYATEQSFVDNLGEGRSFSAYNYTVLPWSALFYRIGFEMPFRFMATGMMITIMLGVAASFKYRFKEIVVNNNPQTYWILVFILTLLSSNFMTTSYKGYLPICPDIRHFLFLIPIAVVAAAPILVDFLQGKKYQWLFIITTIIITALSFYFDAGNFKWIYLAFLGLFLIRLLLPNQPIIFGINTLLIIIIAVAPVLSSMKSANEGNYIEQRTVVYKYLKKNPHKSLVVTNLIQKNYGQYYFEFEENAPTQFYEYSTLDTLVFPTDATIYVLANGMTRYMSNFNYDDLPRCVKDCYESKQPTTIETIYYSPNVALYKLHEPQLLKAGK